MSPGSLESPPVESSGNEAVSSFSPKLVIAPQYLLPIIMQHGTRRPLINKQVTPGSDTYMSNLIEELKNEHKSILDILDQVRALSISSRQGREKILSARDLLIAHIAKEDEQYYPRLRLAAENDKDLKITLDYFIRDMEEVSKKAMQVFDKYSRGENEAEFPAEIKFLYMVLRDRIRTEENTLFVKFSDV